MWARLHALQQQHITRDELLLELGAARKDAGRAWALVSIELPEPGQAVNATTFTFSLRKDKVSSPVPPSAKASRPALWSALVSRLSGSACGVTLAFVRPQSTGNHRGH